MNSKKIRKFVKKVVETTSAEKYADLMERLGSLNCYIDDNRDHLTDGTGYEILEKYFGESVMDDPTSTDVPLRVITESESVVTAELILYL